MHDQDTGPETVTVKFAYINHRGERRDRHVLVRSIRWGTTQWYPRPGWLMGGMDLDKGKEREFCMRNMAPIGAEIMMGDYDNKMAIIGLGELGSVVMHLSDALLQDLHPTKATEHVGRAELLLDRTTQRIAHIIARMGGATTEPFVWKSPAIHPDHAPKDKDRLVAQPANALEELAKGLKAV
jgi:hypothetical protein